MEVFLRNRFWFVQALSKWSEHVCLCFWWRWWAGRVWRRCIRNRPNARPTTKTPGPSRGSRGPTCWAFAKSWARSTFTITDATLGSFSTPKGCSVFEITPQNYNVSRHKMGRMWCANILNVITLFWVVCHLLIRHVLQDLQVS